MSNFPPGVPQNDPRFDAPDCNVCGQEVCQSACDCVECIENLQDFIKRNPSEPPIKTKHILFVAAVLLLACVLFGVVVAMKTKKPKLNVENINTAAAWIVNGAQSECE